MRWPSTSNVVGSWCDSSLDASLYGREIGITRSTPGQALEAHLAHALGVADRADRGGQLAGHHLRVHAAGLEPLHHRLDLRRRWPRVSSRPSCADLARAPCATGASSRPAGRPPPSGNGTITPIGMPSPALISSARPAPISTTASVIAEHRRIDAHRPVAAEPHARAPSRSGSCPPARSPRCRPTTCESPAAQSRIAAWKTSVPTTRCGDEPEQQDQPDGDQRAAAGRGHAEHEADAHAEHAPRRSCGGAPSRSCRARAPASASAARARAWRCR